MDPFTQWKWQHELAKKNGKVSTNDWFHRISNLSNFPSSSSIPSTQASSSSFYNSFQNYYQKFVSIFNSSDTASLLKWCQTFLRHYHKWIHVLQFFSFTLYRIFPLYHSSGIGQLLYQIQQLLYIGYELVYFILYITLDMNPTSNNNSNNSNAMLNQIRQQEVEDQLMLQNRHSSFYSSQMPYGQQYQPYQQQSFYNNNYTNYSQSNYNAPPQQNFWNTNSSQDSF